jgi:predicted aspartyl protease
MKRVIAALGAALMMAASSQAHAGEWTIAGETPGGYMVNNYYVDTGADRTAIMPRDMESLKLIPLRTDTLQYADGSSHDVELYLAPAICIDGPICVYNLTVVISPIGLIGRDFLDAANATVMIKNHKMYLKQ